MKPLGTGDPVRLGPYRLLGVLGEGGMGKVYVGQDNTGSAAAVKVLRPELAHDSGLAQRFVREALAAQAVCSPGVAAVLGAQTEGGRPWIATEFLAGPTLDQIVDTHGPFDEVRVNALASSIARTLRDIHAAGFVHRDLKPPNIVLTAGGPRVIDFGIARPEHGLTLTTTGQIPVTPGYGAPEQVLGRRVTPAADVFSLGAVLVYAATGHRAFEGAHVAAVQYEVVHGEPRWDGLSPAQHALIAPCLAKEVAARPTPEQIAGAFTVPGKSGDVWRRGPVGDEIRERERHIRLLTAPLPTTSTHTTLSRRRLLAGVAGGGTLLAAGGGTAGWWLLHGTAAERRKKDLFTLPVAVQTPTARLLSADDGDYLVGEAPKALWGPYDVVADDSPSPVPLRDVVIVGSSDGGIAAFNVVDGKRRWAAPDVLSGTRYLSLSDRLVVAVESDGKLRTFVPSTGEPKWTANADAADLLAADAEAVFVVTKDHRLRSVGRSDARIRWTAQMPANFRTTLYARGAVDQGVLVVTTTTGHALAVRTKDGRQVWSLRDMANERQLVAEARDGVVYLNGKTLTARTISDGRQLWSAKAKDMYKKPAEWGRPTLTADSVYASAGGSAQRVELVGGTVTWKSWSLADDEAPVLVQGSGAWMFEDGPGRVSTDDINSGDEIWSFHTYDTKVFGNSGDQGYGIAADGNRVFIRNGASLYAFPVF
ncbi:protein kinase domain-containing protein [Streptomyces sp. YIM S03343]